MKVVRVTRYVAVQLLVTTDNLRPTNSFACQLRKVASGELVPPCLGSNVGSSYCNVFVMLERLGDTQVVLLGLDRCYFESRYLYLLTVLVVCA